AYILLLNIVKDGVGRHILFESRSPSVAWRSLDEQFSPKTSGSKMDVSAEFNTQSYSKGQDTHEFWIRLQLLQSHARSLGQEIAQEIVVDKFLTSLPSEY
ncbi:unnamed protein product, partial [Sphacelaria rigidula]